LSGVNALGVPGEDLPGVFDAIKTIEKIRQREKIVIGSDVIVVGGGNTAVDIAIQMKRLGAANVTLVYRRGTEQMGATVHEQELAQKSGVLIKTWAKPVRVTAEDGKVTTMEFEGTELNSSGKLIGTGKSFTLKADQIYKAIGQTLLPNTWGDPKTLPEIANGNIRVDADFETSLPGVFAGGDCVAEGEDLTVTSVQQGKLAALAIHKKGGQRHG
ncbi:FAD-dependent oxidoreductase, partial [Bdellovibrionota bacterium FG-2]